MRRTRRDLLYGLGASLGSLALTDILAREAKAAAGPLAPKAPMAPVKAKACIFLVMEGGPSHMDALNRKPKLRDLHLQAAVRDPKQLLAEVNQKTFDVGSQLGFRKVGRAGLDMCDQFQHLADPEVADELCFYRGW